MGRRAGSEERATREVGAAKGGWRGGRGVGGGLGEGGRVGGLRPLEAGWGGRVVWGWGGAGGGSPAVPATELAIVRRRGWASSIAEREPGLASVSVPVLRDGALLGALCVSGPASRLGSSPGRRLAPLVVAAARELAALAGAGGPPPGPATGRSARQQLTGEPR